MFFLKMGKDFFSYFFQRRGFALAQYLKKSVKMSQSSSTISKAMIKATPRYKLKAPPRLDIRDSS